MSNSSTSQPVNKLAGQLRHRLLLSIEQFPVLDKVMLGKALATAEEIHKAQYRKANKENTQQGAPYIVHPMRVALIIAEELELKEPLAIATALLHDSVEMSGGKLSISQVEETFGRPIAMMVSILTKPSLKADTPFLEREQKLKIYRDRISHASVETKLVKLADRLDNLRDSYDILDKGFQMRYLKETRDFYLPMAEFTDPYLQDEIAVACDHLEKAIKFG
ncbi:MAG: bifunctional (p)ppGpp synthetase/guanosine-3',5'-bis(diphosphate) 3'-pyrophosphohydrolase [Cyanobacteria bacterium SZAS LIN-3]|nr:bifunctional (p)ppGpp synthetase/guanosine-3',5'-bis(diphosphate) 3'-pyrophosphohydrolase [Cyanobacteria bacterium SZAS LIN-3]MBS2010578.1 bifunctional (p)ppGpp synthetase/guanosine-3',5'-bis(diphosphate) 3'-pyrophosphohydrolase [Cyanobacteria bacterium SZAS TMP-1]